MRKEPGGQFLWGGIAQMTTQAFERVRTFRCCLSVICGNRLLKSAARSGHIRQQNVEKTLTPVGTVFQITQSLPTEHIGVAAFIEGGHLGMGRQRSSEAGNRVGNALNWRRLGEKGINTCL